MTKKKALYLSTMWPPFGQGGEELTNQENYSILSELFDIQVLTTTPEVSPSFAHNTPQAGEDKNIHRLLNPENPEYNSKVFIDLLKRHRPDVVLVGHPYGFGPGLIDEIRRARETKIFFIGDITVYQDNACGNFPPDYFTGEHCIFVSDFTRLCLQAGWHSFLPETKRFRFDPDKCYTLYPSIEKQEKHADISRFSVCSMGRFDAVKGFDTIVASALEHGYAKHITLYGDGMYFPKYSELVHCPGWLHSDIKLDTLRKHSVFIFNIRYHETFGRTWLEAASVGLPLVLSDLDVMQEVVAGDYAIMFKRGDNNDLARAVRQLTDISVREEYQEKALALAAIYSHERKRRRLLDIVQHIPSLEL